MSGFSGGTAAAPGDGGRGQYTSNVDELLKKVYATPDLPEADRSNYISELMTLRKGDPNSIGNPAAALQDLTNRINVAIDSMNKKRTLTEEERKKLLAMPGTSSVFSQTVNSGGTSLLTAGMNNGQNP